jgi:putative transposase
MQEYQSLNHTKWECKYHVVWIPKCRKKTLYGAIKKELVPIIRELARQKECEILEGKMVGDHVHMVVSIPPKYAVAQVMGFIKGKSAIWVARRCGRKRNFTGQNFWARGYCVSTIGLDDETVREYVKRQEEEDKKLDQLKMFEEDSLSSDSSRFLTALSGSRFYQAPGSAGGCVTGVL